MSSLSQLKVGLLLPHSDLGQSVMRILRNLPLRIVMERPSLGEGVLFQGQLKQLGPDALVVDMALVGGRFPDFMAMVRGIPSPPAVIAIHTSPDPQMILSAMRAGASEFLYPPIDESILVQALERLTQERQAAEPSRNARAIGFLSPMGGCGASTVAAHVASELARVTNREVLLADFDMVSGMVGFWMNIKQGYSMVDVLKNVHRLDASLWGGLVTKSQNHLDVLTGPPEAVLETAGDPNLFLDVLRFARSSYDWVVADLGHGLTPQSMTLLTEMNTAYLVVTTEVAALYQARRVVRKLMDVSFERDRVKVILNRLDKRPNFMPDDVEKLLGLQVETTLPRDADAIEEAHEEARLISNGSELRKRIAKFAATLGGAQPDSGPPSGGSRFSIFGQYGTQALF